MESMPVIDPDKYQKELLSRCTKLKRQSTKLIAKMLVEPPYTKRSKQWLQEAISKLNDVLSINPRDPGALFNLGCIDMLNALWHGDADKGRAILQDTKDKVAKLKEELKKESLSRKNEGQVKGLVLMNAPSKDANTQLQHPRLQQKQQRQPLMQISQQQSQMHGQYQMQFPSSMGTSQFEGWQLPAGPGQYPMLPGVGQQFSAIQGTPNSQMMHGQYQMQFPSSMGTSQFEGWQLPAGPGQYQFEGQYPMQPGVGQRFSAIQGTPNSQMEPPLYMHHFPVQYYTQGQEQYSYGQYDAHGFPRVPSQRLPVHMQNFPVQYGTQAEPALHMHYLSGQYYTQGQEQYSYGQHGFPTASQVVPPM